MAGGGGSGGSQTVTQTQQIPVWEQQFAQNNQNIARSLASTPYPNYQGQLLAPLNDLQNQGIAGAGNAAYSYQPYMNQAQGATSTALAGMTPYALQNINALSQSGMKNVGLSASDNNTVQQYMSPYVKQALAPQLAQLQTQLDQQQKAVNSGATSANAFGDARNGVQSALADYYGNQVMSGVVGQGYNTAYNNAIGAIQNQQNLGSQQLNAANSALGQQQQIGLQGANQLANMAGMAQQYGLTGANAIYNAGQKLQDQQQTGLNLAYQQYQNQVNWPFQMLNVLESALSNSPYSMTNTTTLPQSNQVASGLGSFASLAGLLGSSGGAKAPIGGTAFS